MATQPLVQQPLIPRPRGRGRPRRDRQRHTFAPVIESALVGRLEELADRFDTSVGLLAEDLAGRAHGYVSPWAPKFDLASVGIDLDRVEADVDAIRAADCVQPEGERVTLWCRLDEPVAYQIRCRCDGLDVSYRTYMRRVLLLAVGLENLPVQSRLELADGEGTSR